MTAFLTDIESVSPSWLWSDTIEPVLIKGWAFHNRAFVTEVTADVGGSVLPALACGIERTDVYERFRETPRRSANARHSGFAVAGLAGPVTGESAGGVVVVELETGDRHPSTRFELPVRNLSRRFVDLPGSPTVAVVMATHNPPSGLFQSQVHSLMDQSLSSWACIVCDDNSTASSKAEIHRAIGDDHRFKIIENDERLGFYRNFERGLNVIPPDVRYVALADQDDLWYPDKLARLVEYLDRDEDAQLVASDARLVDVGGAVVAESFYEHRVPTHDDPYSLFLVNSLIGASMMFRRAMLDTALPFPRAFDDVYHDHWLARVASGMGSIGFVAEPLYDYVQHGANVLGRQSPVDTWPVRRLVKPGLRWLLRVDVAEVRERWGESFFSNVLEPRLAAEVLRARWPPARDLQWLNRIVAEPSYREVVRVLMDQHRESRADRLRRENVDVARFSGHLWSLEHLPSATQTARCEVVT